MLEDERAGVNQSYILYKTQESWTCLVGCDKMSDSF